LKRYYYIDIELALAEEEHYCFWGTDAGHLSLKLRGFLFVSLTKELEPNGFTGD
jgi:hypothetical protein